MNDEYRTDGGLNSIDKWINKTKGYLFGVVPCLLYLFEWAERREHQVITHEMIQSECLKFNLLSEADLKTVNSGIWTFLQMCTHGAAATTHGLAEPLNGLDSWCRIIMAANRGRSLRVGQLRRAVRRPEEIRSLEGVPSGVDKFDTAIKRLVEAGGTKPTDGELKQDLLEILPRDFRESLMWLADRPDGYQHFREHVLTKAAEVLDNRGKLGHIASVEDQLKDVMAIAGEARASADDGGNATTPNVIERIDEILAAFKGGPTKRPPGPPRPPAQEGQGSEAKRGDSATEAAAQGGAPGEP